MIVQLATVNRHGICEGALEIVSVPMPAGCPCRCNFILGQLADGWRWGCDWTSPVGHVRSGPRQTDAKYATSNEALLEGLNRATKYFRRDLEWLGPTFPKAKEQIRQTLDAIQAFTVQRFFHQLDEVPMPATAEPKRKKTNGHPNGKSNGHAPVNRIAGAMARAIADSGRMEMIEVHRIHPHPDNRKIGDEDPDVLELAASMAADGLMQAITVRVPPAHWDLPDGHFQLVDGERRWRAARANGWSQIRCQLRTDLDDADTKRLLAIANAQRKDLNPIEKAQLIEQLCTGNADGSPPLTREQAAQAVGLESGAAASNLVRLLELPPAWQARVAAGELPWTWAREMLPIVQLEPVLKLLEEDWETRETAESWDENSFGSRKILQESIVNLVESECRRLDREGYANGRFAKLKVNVEDPQVREQLGIVEVELASGKRGQTERVLVATDVKAFDAALAKQVATKSKAAAEAAGRDEPKRELTPAEKKRKAEERGRLRSERIAAWRHKFLRQACIAAIDATGDSGVRILLGFAAEEGSRPFGTLSFPEALRRTLGREPRHRDLRTDWWPVVGPIDLRMLGSDDRANSEEEVLPALAKHLLAHETEDWRRPTLPHALVEGYAAALGVDVGGEWSKLQEPFDYQPPFDRQGLLEEFFLLHQTEELKELAKELGVHLLPSLSTRRKIVDHLLAIPRGTSRRLPLPKSIKPLAGEKPTKAKAKNRE
jgi:ParB/RepB/Spo0J family partition protein